MKLKNRTLACCFNSLAGELDVQFKLEPTSLSNIKYIVTMFGIKEG